MPSDEVRKQVSEMCMIIHTSVEDVAEKFWNELRRRVYTTPKSYLDLIKLYIDTLNFKRKDDTANKDRLGTGLKKLHTTNQNIADLKEKLKVLAPQLEKKSKEVAIASEKTKKDKALATEQENAVSEEKEKVLTEKNAADELADQCEYELKRAQPLLDSAKRAVDKLTSDSITTIKSYSKPPPLVEHVT